MKHQTPLLRCYCKMISCTHGMQRVGMHLVGGPFDVRILPEAPHTVEADGVAIVVVLRTHTCPQSASEIRLLLV